jgi:hypothetical protein
LGEAENQTYQKTSFGSFGGSTIEEHTVQPWIQSAEIRYQDKVAWSTRWGGVPYSMFLREGQSLGSELQKSSNPSYELFDQLEVPEELLYPRYQKGLGTTEITPTGFVDKAN